jgi:hypothetical protein
MTVSVSIRRTLPFRSTNEEGEITRLSPILTVLSQRSVILYLKNKNLIVLFRRLVFKGAGHSGFRLDLG